MPILNRAFYLNASSSDISMNVTIGYNCKYGTEIVPFVFVNSTWDQIYNYVILQNPCRITFPTSNNHIIALFTYTPSMQNTTTLTSVVTTTGMSGVGQTSAIYYYMAVVIIIILIITIYLLRRNSSKRK